MVVQEEYGSAQSRRRRLLAANGGGVEVFPAAARGIGKLTDLHTLGVVNASGAGGKAFLVELKKLTQLRKLGVSGINRKNWLDMCGAISGHGHLESLSLQITEEGDDNIFACNFDHICDPPKTMKCLKVHSAGNTCIRASWMKQIPNIQKFDLEVTIATQEDIYSLNEGFPCRLRRLRLKPIQQQQLQLSFSKSPASRYPFRQTEWNQLEYLMIDCRSVLHSEVTFVDFIATRIQVLKVLCSSESSTLHLSDLWRIRDLKEVWLMGSYSEDLQRDLVQQLEDPRFQVRRKKPVLKLMGSLLHPAQPINS